LSLRSDNLDSIGELYTVDDFRQLIVPIEATPAFLGGLGELEDHGDRVIEHIVRIRVKLPSSCPLGAFSRRLMVDCDANAAPLCGHRPTATFVKGLSGFGQSAPPVPDPNNAAHAPARCQPLVTSDGSQSSTAIHSTGANGFPICRTDATCAETSHAGFGKIFFQLPHHAVSTLTFALMRGSTTEIACK
jgi:hypothetical protein